jgi:hypothetical protein
MCIAKEVQAQKNGWRIFVRAAVLVGAIPAVVARKLWITNIKTFSTIA